MGRKPGVSEIPGGDAATLRLDDKDVPLTNLEKVYFPRLELRKRDLLQYYLDIAPVLLPHIRDRAIVMKRYPNGVTGDFFYMKRAPSRRPPWIRTCEIEHGSGTTIDFAVVDDRASLLWLINLGCIDINPWYSRCADPSRPLVIHFDLDPTDGTRFTVVRRAALVLREVLVGLGMTPFVKTTGSTGLHIYVAIRVGPTQREVWEIAKEIGVATARAYPKVLTSAYRIADRPRNRVLVDYNQNAFGKTLASVYSVRSNEAATVSAPVTWEEVEAGCEPGDFTLLNMRERVASLGDLWKPLLGERSRFDLRDLERHAAI